jgi:hypothetical protein
MAQENYGIGAGLVLFRKGSPNGGPDAEDLEE